MNIWVQGKVFCHATRHWAHYERNAYEPRTVISLEEGKHLLSEWQKRLEELTNVNHA